MQLIFNFILYSNLNVDPKVKICLTTKNNYKDLGLPRFPLRQVANRKLGVRRKAKILKIGKRELKANIGSLPLCI
jgi:hypothetical protein